MTVWIGEIQWMRRNGFDASRNPILKPLDNIECRDALFPNDSDAPWPNVAHLWPKADAIIGNPPFLGDKLTISYLGEHHVRRLRSGYSGWVAGGADLVCYWFAIADRMLRQGLAVVSDSSQQTQSVVAPTAVSLKQSASITSLRMHGPDEGWTVEGAAVRVSLICFASEANFLQPRLNGEPVSAIFADLNGGAIDWTTVCGLPQNRGRAFQGREGRSFDVSGDLAREWLRLPHNVNGRHNADVVRPWANGMDVTRRPSERWIIDFDEMAFAEVAQYEAPFEHTREVIKPVRDKNRDAFRRTHWWRLGRSGTNLKAAIAPLSRYIITLRVSKHRIFVWRHVSVLPDSRLYAIAREDDVSFGILHSRFHERWSLATCSSFPVLGNLARLDVSFSSLLFRCFGAATIEASTIWPPMAR